MKDLLENIHKFDWRDLHGKVLKITVGESEEDGMKYMCVMGVDENGHYYVVCLE